LHRFRSSTPHFPIPVWLPKSLLSCSLPLMKTVLISALLSVAAAQGVQFPRARAILFLSRPGDFPGEKVGVVDFFQENAGVRLNGTINGLSAGLHGFHVHDKGDLSNGCLAAGPHFNPLMKNHGAPNASVRHHGDLGNIESPASGVTQIQLRDSYLSLNGPMSIIGRAIVVHEKADDLGLGGTEASRTTGDAGARYACGVIAIMDEDPAARDKSSTSLLTLVSTITVILAYLVQ
ncbi:hypothetical protein PFISCL1PPCAC_9370, partial [Pristionchus fissidentatus]